MPNPFIPRIRTFAVVLLLLAPFTATASRAPAAERELRNVAMILFRGETASERGFRDTVQESKQYLVRCRVFDAGQSKERLNWILSTLDTSKYHLVYTFGTTATRSAMEEIKDLPIVYNVVQRPVEAGIIRSWKSSGNNVTGASNIVGMESAFRTLALMMSIRKLGFVYNDNDPAPRFQRAEMESIRQKFGFRIIDFPVRNRESIPEAMRRVVAAKPDAVVLPSDSLIKANAATIVSVLNRHRIPAIATIPELVAENGALISLGPDYYELGQLAARNALEIFGGKRPAEVGSKTVPSLHLCINLKTADRLGINFPLQLVSAAKVVR